MQINNNSFFSPDELERLHFKSIGQNVLISKKASFYDLDEISIGNNVRIDDFCILSGKVHLGDYIHISAQCLLYGARGIIMRDFSGLSPGCKVFSATDDFSGEHLIGPMVPEQFTYVKGGAVTIGRYVQVGAGSIIMPKLDIGEGVAVGSMSLVNSSLEPWGIYTGIPVKRLKERAKKIIELALSIKKG